MHNYLAYQKRRLCKIHIYAAKPIVNWKTTQLCIMNYELCIMNYELCIMNYELCIEKISCHPLQRCIAFGLGARAELPYLCNRKMHRANRVNKQFSKNKQT